MKVLRLKVATLVSDPRNARKHDATSLDAITKSLAKFGQQKPIVVGSDGVVIAGNGTLAAAAALGWKTLAAVKSELTGEAARAFAIADNRSAELSTWDYQVLAETIRDLENAGFDVASTGWTPAEMVNFMGALDWTPGDGNGDELDQMGPQRYSLKFTPADWKRLVAVLGSDKMEKMVPEIVRRLCGG